MRVDLVSACGRGWAPKDRKKIQSFIPTTEILQKEMMVIQTHMLLSDFQMKGMTGIDLATQITAQRPKIKVLLMSGYTGGMLVLNEGWHFLPKPFIPSQLRVLVAGLISPPKSKFEAA